MIVLRHNDSVVVYSLGMDFIRDIKIPFGPVFHYLALSPTRLLVFDVFNRIVLIDTEKEKPIEIDSPKGTSPDKPIAHSAVLKLGDDYLFLPTNTAIRKSSYVYCTRENKFRRINIKLPDYCFAFWKGKEGAFFLLDEDCGDFKACSFETAYKKREFVPELVIEKKVISETVWCQDPFKFASSVAHLSVEKQELILVSSDKPYKTASFSQKLGKEHYMPNSVRETLEYPETGKAFLLKNGSQKVLGLKYRPFLFHYNNFSDSIIFLNNGEGTLDAYSTDDLTLLTSFPSLTISPNSIFLPDGRMAYEINGDTYLSDSSPLAVATEKLEELKRGH